MTLQRLYIHYIQIFSYSARIHFEGDWLPRGYIRRFALQIRIKMSLSFRIEFQAPKDYNVKPFMYLLILKYYIFACSILKLLIRQTYQTAQLAPLKTSNDSVKTTIKHRASGPAVDHLFSEVSCCTCDHDTRKE